jgi:HSP20 family molecular chaperone IbpA
MLVQHPGDPHRADPNLEGRGQPGGVMPMDAYLDADRLVVHVDLLDADPETVSVGMAGDVLTVTAARTSGNGPDTRYRQELSLDRTMARDSVQARVHDGVVTVMVDLRDRTDA